MLLQYIPLDLDPGTRNWLEEDRALVLGGSYKTEASNRTIRWVG